MKKMIIVLCSALIAVPAIAQDTSSTDQSLRRPGFSETLDNPQFERRGDVWFWLDLLNRGGHGRGRGGHHRNYVVCTAQNLRGYQFRASGWSTNQAARQALGNCYASGSRRCKVISCY
jgi:hypothetical protein